MAAFDHVMGDVLGRPILKAALESEGIQDIYALLTIDETTINGLVYSDEEGTTTAPLPRGDKNLIRVFLGYYRYRSGIGDPIEDWLTVTEAGFNEFRLNPSFVQAGIAPSTGGYTHPVPTPGPSPPAPKPSPADLFRRGIKRDPSLFPELKDERHNDAWHRSFMTQARAQGVDDALDLSYVPHTTEEADLFQEKQKYLYAVLESKVKTDRGKLIVRKYDQDYDARTVYQELSEHHTKSTKAAMSAAALLSYITSERLGNGQWKGTTEGFITHWQEQVRQYERQVEPSDYFSDGQKRTMLENAVRDVDELRQVKVNADLERTMTGKVLTYDQYAALLLSTAVGYDTHRAGGRSRGKHVVYQHELDPDPLPTISDYVDESFNIDYTVEEPVSVNVHRTSSPGSNRSPASMPDKRVRLPFDRWSQLSDTDKKTWDTLDDKAKAIILGSSGPKSQQPRMSNTTRGPARRVNLHDMSAYDLLHAFVAHTGLQEDPSPDHHQYSDDDLIPYSGGTSDEAHPTDDPSLLINAAKTSKPLAPSDIRRILSPSSKRSPSHGTPRLSANMHRIVYSVSRSDHRTPQSLVDRGANGGIAGADVRVIDRTLRSVDIQGIDNHQLCDVSIGTVGGVVHTHCGPVLAIFHQYALYGKGSSIHAPVQLEFFKNTVDEKSRHAGGNQYIKSPDGQYIIPLGICNGLARLPIRPYTDDEWDTLPHVILTDQADWDPSVLDCALEDVEVPQDAIALAEEHTRHNLFDPVGTYKHRVTAYMTQLLSRVHSPDVAMSHDTALDTCVLYAAAMTENGG